MVRIRVTGRPDEIQAAIARIDRVMYVTTAGAITRPVGRGAHYRDMMAELEPIECEHRTAAVARRGATEQFGSAAWGVEYGLCQDCGARVVRVRAQNADGVLAVGAWSGLTEVSNPNRCTVI